MNTTLRISAEANAMPNFRQRKASVVSHRSFPRAISDQIESKIQYDRMKLLAK
jgi:hypothetical protein